TDLLAQLINKSLVTVVANTVGNDVETRYGMLETIREYARGKLDDSAETDRLRQRHRDFFISFAEQAERKLRSAEQFKSLDRLEIEYANLRGAWNCAIESDPELALRLASALLYFWYARGNPGEGREWMSKLLPQTNHWGQSAMRAQALSTAGFLAYLQDDFGSARSLLEEALKIVQVVKDKKVTAFVLLWIGRVAYFQREHQTAYAFIEECLTIYQELQDQWGIAMAIYHLASFDAVQGHYQEAKEQFRKSLAIFQDLGDKLWAGHVLNGLGELARLKGDYERAGKFYAESIELHRQQRSRLAGVVPLLNLAWVSLHKGDHSKAKVLFNQVFKLFKENGSQLGVGVCLLGFAGLLAVTGKPEMAAWLFGALESSYESMELQERREFDHYVSVVRGRLDEATFASALAKGRAMTLEQAIVYALEETASP
ncbi:MAG: tetratricopeptide repeat protein, partial [Anaerolineae bacterium]|nr:tetratricopeptide repeat protein [Anaerolineae bacterium]